MILNASLSFSALIQALETGLKGVRRCGLGILGHPNSKRGLPKTVLESER